ncbi:kelch-like protein 30 [Littorina saxatilis]|uniref:BTB domain-containing protein n=1 Tax=Littorina saxatilis TaxID=31220 RepID=A0AAN9BIH0_9CAEN
MKLSILDEHRSVRLTHYDSSLQPVIMQQFHACRHSNRFIDLEVEVEGVVFSCHQILLDAFCPYFAAYFSFHERSGGGTEIKKGGDGGPGVDRVSLKYNGVTVNGFSKLLEFMYTGELEVTADDVIDVLRCADFLQFHQVVHLCSAFLQQHITAETCLQVLVLARAHDLHDLAQKALSFVLTNLSEAMHHPEFTKLSHKMLVNILSHDHLEVATEATVAEAVVIWVKGDDRCRMCHLPALLQHARMQSVDFQHFDKVFYSLNTEVIGKKRGGDVDCVLQSALDNLAVSPLPDRLTEVLVVVCRETLRKHRGVIRDLSTLYFYDPEALRWEVLTRLPFDDRQDYSAMVVDNVLYLTGGQSMDIHDIYCTKIVFNENWTYDPLVDKWEERQSMMIPRYNHSAAAMQDKLYVVGGRAASSSYSLRGDGEVYDPHTNQWTFISHLRCIDGIGNAALASLDGKLFLCGGTYYTPGRRSHIPYEDYTGAQVYNPKEDLWQELLSLERDITQRRLRMSRGNIVTMDGFLLLLDDDVGKSHQLYNPVSQTLTSLMQAHGHHWYAGWAVYRGQLVCTGGLEDGRSGMTDMVHAWDLADVGHAWNMMPPLPRAMSHHACLNMHLNLPRPGTEEESLLVEATS